MTDDTFSFEQAKAENDWHATHWDLGEVELQMWPPDSRGRCVVKRAGVYHLVHVSMLHNIPPPKPERCSACSQTHLPGVMCPPHEVRTTGKRLGHDPMPLPEPPKEPDDG